MAIVMNKPQYQDPWGGVNAQMMEWFAEIRRKKEYEKQQGLKLQLAGYKPLSNKSYNPTWDLLPESQRDKLMREKMPERFEGADVVVGSMGYKAPRGGEGSVKDYNKNFHVITDPDGKKRLVAKPKPDKGSFGTINVQTSKGPRIARVNKHTGKITVTNKKPVPTKSGGSGGAGSPEVKRKQDMVRNRLDEIRKANGIRDGFDLMTYSMLETDEERKTFLKRQLKSVLDKLPAKARSEYIRWTNKLDEITEAGVGDPRVLTQPVIDRYLDDANGDPIKAEQLAREAGYRVD